MRIYSECPRAHHSKDSFQKGKKSLKNPSAVSSSAWGEVQKGSSQSTHGYPCTLLAAAWLWSYRLSSKAKNEQKSSLLVSLHGYIKPGDRRQHQVPRGISQQGSSPTEDLRDCGDLCLWICFSVCFPFNDAEERSVSTKEDVSVTGTALVSGSTQAAAWNWLEKLLCLVLLLVFWGRKKLPALITQSIQSHKEKNVPGDFSQKPETFQMCCLKVHSLAWSYPASQGPQWPGPGGEHLEDLGIVWESWATLSDGKCQGNTAHKLCSTQFQSPNVMEWVRLEMPLANI